MNQHLNQLSNLLINSVEDSLRNIEQSAIAFSGGIDSSLITKLASKHTTVNLYVIGIKDSYDIKSAKESAELLKLPLNIIEITKQDVENAIPEIIKLMRLKPNPRNTIIVSFELPLYFVAKNCKEKYILTGQGSDELFLGYAKYKTMNKKELEENQKRIINELLKETIPREQRICSYFGKKLKTPFITQEIVDFTLRLQIDLKKEKRILREVAKNFLSKEIYKKRKKAAQYGSGTMKIIKEIAKERRMNVKEYISGYTKRV